jgi:hypothetical protein
VAATTAARAKPPVASGQPYSTMDFILKIFPDNFVGAFAKSELLQVLVIAIIFGREKETILPLMARRLLLDACYAAAPCSERADGSSCYLESRGR